MIAIFHIKAFENNVILKLTISRSFFVGISFLLIWLVCVNCSGNKTTLRRSFYHSINQKDIKSFQNNLFDKNKRNIKYTSQLLLILQHPHPRILVPEFEHCQNWQVLQEEHPGGIDKVKQFSQQLRVRDTIQEQVVGKDNIPPMRPRQRLKSLASFRVLDHVLLNRPGIRDVMWILLHVEHLVLAFVLRQVKAWDESHAIGDERELLRVKLCADPRESVKIRIGHHGRVLWGQQQSRDDDVSENGITSRSNRIQIVACTEIEAVIDAQHVAHDSPKVAQSHQILGVEWDSKLLVIADDVAHE